MKEPIPEDWRRVLGHRLATIDLEAIDRFVASEGAGHDVYPQEGMVFEALRQTHFDVVRAVILGQDPYHEAGQAHGLAFSTLAKKWPPSLVNILAEWSSDLSEPKPANGSLESWAKHGVLLLNTVVTVKPGKANSHAGHGWEQLTSAIVDVVAAKPGPIVFMLWGRHAQACGVAVDRNRHIVVERSHPSPYSARINFLGTHPFSCANAALQARGAEPINWSLDG